ncbi:sodium-dependent transporter [Ruminococcus sp.]|uniref:sodium-dependent transporter n=1 Tax=Ruminococcus sp. TaxID=41978 RepID=UPI001B0EBB23|nr:sodium-dependent transporter [Ruminococcus sp.]MBO5558912.1 sodium-dependent transporter [Ruminococcus sp.]
MEKTNLEKRNSFSSSLGFVLAAAGSAVGLGNIWRFPYLAAKNGGGIFLVVYLVLALTFGFTLLVTEVSLGRKTKQSCLTAYGALHKKSGWIGVFASIVPFMILPYYCIIGGWVLKYFTVFAAGGGSKAADDSYFGNFITAPISPIVFDVIFLAATAFVIYKGVNKGIEAISKVLMPLLLLAIIGISVFALTLKGDDGRTGLEGFKIFVVPNIDGMGIKEFFTVVLDAMGQLFYSISVAMGIMVTYGSYFRDDDNLMQSVNRIEIFDTLVAFLAGVMIIPSVFAFLGEDGLSNAGPGLMFVALPKVFDAMGPVGNWIGAAFFLMVLFAALTSSMSILEAVVSGLMDKFKWSRTKAVIIESAAALLLGVIICLGYNKLYFEIKLPNGNSAQMLDVFDYISNNILMPVVAISTCILIGWIAKPKSIIDEATKNGEKFGRRGMYIVMIKFIEPVLLFILLLGAFGLFSK